MLSAYFSCLVRLGFIIGYDTVRCSIVRFMSVHWHGKHFFLGQNGAYHIKDNYLSFCMFVCRSIVQKFKDSFSHELKPTNSIYFDIPDPRILDLFIFFQIVFVDTYPLAKYLQIQRLQSCEEFSFLPGIIRLLWIGSDASLGVIQLWLRKANATIVI